MRCHLCWNWRLLWELNYVRGPSDGLTACGSSSSCWAGALRMHTDTVAHVHRHACMLVSQQHITLEESSSQFSVVSLQVVLVFLAALWVECIWLCLCVLQRQAANHTFAGCVCVSSSGCKSHLASCLRLKAHSSAERLSLMLAACTAAAAASTPVDNRLTICAGMWGSSRKFGCRCVQAPPFLLPFLPFPSATST